MECKGEDGFLRVQFTSYGGNPKSYSIIYYFTYYLNSFELQSSIETQYALSTPYPSLYGPITIYFWQTEKGLSPTKGVGLFLAAPRSGRDYVLRLTDHDLMMNDYNLRPKPIGPKF